MKTVFKVIDELLKCDKIFVDTCSLMEKEAFKCFNKLGHLLLTQQKKLIIPAKVIEEVNANLDKPAKQKDASRAAKIIKEFQKYNLIEIRGEKDDPFADNLFIQIFTRYRLKYSLALITQDRNLAKEILDLAKSDAVRNIKPIKVFKITSTGELEQWKRESKIKPQKLVNIPDRKINITFLPKENDRVYSKKFGYITLTKLVSQGGEGSIYLCSVPSKVCKIYHKDKLTVLKYEKIKLMVNTPLVCDGICWPEDLLLFNNQFIGYIMPKAEGKPMQTCMFTKQMIAKNFPYWRKEHLVKLAITVLDKILFLHKHNVIVGDINPLNILIKDENKIYFVDTDSFQIEGFPCPVGTANFTPSELQGKDFKTFLRTFEHEYFAVATLLFMILLPGKPPYSHQGGGTPGENIKKKNFPYPLGEKSTGQVPKGPWRFIWSHLPYKVKEAFYDVFKEDKRILPEKWKELMESYLYALQKGYVTNELFPTHLKIREGYECSVRCQKCGVLFQLDKAHYKYLKSKNKPIFCDKCYNEMQLLGETALNPNVSPSFSTHKKQSKTTQASTPKKSVYELIGEFFKDIFS